MFLVGAGGGCSHNNTIGVPGGGGGGFTKTFKRDTAGYRDGNAITVTPGQTIEIIVGAGVSGANGGYSQFMNSNYRAEGGHLSQWNGDGNGGSGGVGTGRSTHSVGGSDGTGSGGTSGQGHTTRDFGEPNGKRNAGGGASSYNRSGGETSQPGTSDIQKEVAKEVMKVVLWLLAGVPGLVVAATVVELGGTHPVKQPKAATALSSSAIGHTKNNNLFKL